MVYSLNFVYNTKILYKINQAAKQASKQNDFDQASQASKLKALSLACLLVTNSGSTTQRDMNHLRRTLHWDPHHHHHILQSPAPFADISCESPILLEP